jgi:hypothetical protein
VGEQLLRDDAAGVAQLDLLVDEFAVEVAGFGAGGGFEVVGDAAGGGEGGVAKGAGDLGAAVGAGVQMLGRGLADAFCVKERGP